MLEILIKIICIPICFLELFAFYIVIKYIIDKMKEKKEYEEKQFDDWYNGLTEDEKKLYQLEKNNELLEDQNRILRRKRRRR